MWRSLFPRPWVVALLLPLLLAMAAWLPAAGAGHTPVPRAEARELVLATTTSTKDSGLLDALIPLFEHQTGYRVKPIAVGTGAALALGARGEADVVLTHAPSAERRWMAEGNGTERLLVMHNEFVIVGPPSDPAAIEGEPSAVVALRKIAQSGAQWISRADNSGTDMLERELWKAAELSPQGQHWYLTSGLGMSATLTVADQKDAYTLSDRATHLARKGTLQLQVMVEGDPQLLNLYHVMPVNQARFRELPINAEGGQAFARFLVSPAAQELIATFGKGRYGRALFTPAAGKTEEQVRRERIAPAPELEERSASRAVGMELLWQGLREGVRLFLSADPQLLHITALSLGVSLSATALAALVGVPLGVALSIGRFRGQALLQTVVNTGMGLPPVVVGLIVMLLLWRTGPFGFLQLLYTPSAMVIAQFIVAAPIAAGLTRSALGLLDPDLVQALRVDGASDYAVGHQLVRAALPQVVVAIAAAFGRAVAEVGASLMVGGSIAGQTEILTTAIALETRKGEFALAIALGLVLLAVAFTVNSGLTWRERAAETA